MRKILYCAVATALIASVGTNVCAASFTDLDEHWAKTTVEELSEKGIINGYADGSFRPGGQTNVDAFIKMVTMSLGLKIDNGSDYWASTFIAKARDLNLIEVGEYTDYEVPITREQIAKMIVKALKVKATSAETQKSKISDYSKITAGYEEYVLAAFEKGIVTGDPDGSFRAADSATRAECAVMISRMLKIKAEQDHNAPSTPSSVTDYKSAVDILVNKGIVEDGDYWEDNAIKGKRCADTNVTEFLIKVSGYFGEEVTNAKDAIATLVEQKIINQPASWIDQIESAKGFDGDSMANLLINIARTVNSGGAAAKPVAELSSSVNEAIDQLVADNTLSDAAYWKENAVKGKFPKADQLEPFIIKFASTIKATSSFKDAIDVLVGAGIISQADSWKSQFDIGKGYDGDSVGNIIINIARYKRQGSSSSASAATGTMSDEVSTAIDAVIEAGLTNDRDYWFANAIKGKLCATDKSEALFKAVAEKGKPVSNAREAIKVLNEMDIISKPDSWYAEEETGKGYDGDAMGNLFIKISRTLK